ncbi:N-acetylglucosamine-specific PTS transporter subunit IIBC [Zooshikella harenae]|nr:N-acetylglucosamine-specific PTS transporter subunit IIBC [Zooshikella harenae]
MNILGWFQGLGRALMLPIAVLPVAGLLLRLGATDVFDIPFLFKAGEAIFANLPLIFAIGVAIGFSKDGQGAAALAGGVGYLVLTTAMSTINEHIDMGVLAGILMGVVAGFSYNRFSSLKLPDYLAFFGGKRSVPIITAAIGCILAVVFGYVWPPIQHGIDVVGNWITGSGAVGAFVYGTANRLLIPTGLHHVLNNLVWFVFGSFPGTGGEVVNGDLHRFFAGDPTAGAFMTGFYPVMMFGLPAACLAMYTTAKQANRKKVAGILLGVGLTSFLTGVTEPVEFIFMFLAPILYLIHALLTGLSLAVCSLLDIRHGFAFSAGAIDYGLNFGLANKGGWLIPLGLVWFVLYYVLFVFAIKRFDLKTPGREDENDLNQNQSIAGSSTSAAVSYLMALGGHENITQIDACLTRLRLTVKDQSLIEEKTLEALGAKGIVKLGAQNVQVIIGPQAAILADEMRGIPADVAVGHSEVSRSDTERSNEKESSLMNNQQAREDQTVLVAPVSGEIVAIEDVPDPVFAQKMAGDGIAINPTGDTLVAPCEGVIGKIFRTNHAFTLTTDAGVELFVHFGVDTVNLKGEGFERLMEEGKHVKPGDPVIRLNLPLLQKTAVSVLTPVVISNGDQFASLEKKSGQVTAGEDPILVLNH